MKFNNFEELFAIVEGKPNRVVVPGANNEEALKAIKMADDKGMISGGVLIGPVEKIKSMLKENGLDENKFDLIESTDIPEMCKLAVDNIVAGKGDFLIKGQVETKYYMKAILNKEAGLVKPGALLTHNVLYHSPRYKKPFIVTDSAILISPTLEQKVKIVENVVKTLRQLGVEKPKISIVCPVEKINPKIPSTIDAAELEKMSKEGKIDAIVEGPYDVYISFSEEKAKDKGVVGKQVPGDADAIVLADLNAANPFYKCLNFFGDRVKAATILAGSKVPIILPSRSDEPEVKLNSIALCSFLKDQK